MGDTAIPDPHRLAAATEGCPSVARLHAGPAGAYLPGKRISGISIDEHTVTLHVDLAYPATVSTLGREVREAVTELLAGRTLVISVDDVVLPEDNPAAPTTDPANPPTSTGVPS